MLILGVSAGISILLLFANLAANPVLASSQAAATQFGSIFSPIVVAGAAEKEPASPVIEAPAKESSPANDAAAGCAIGQSFPANVLRWCDLIQRYASTNSLDPNVIAAVMVQESGGNPQAYSHSGAVGLLQVMPRDGLAASFQCKNGPCFGSRPSMAELYDPEYNVRFGTGMLAGLSQRHGNLREALRAYGPGDAGYTYADKVLAIYNAHAGD